MNLKRKIQLKKSIREIEHVIDKVSELKANGFNVNVEPIVMSYFELVQELYIVPLQEPEEI